MLRDKRLFGFLKDRHIFKQGGAKSFREYMTFIESRAEQNDVARRKRQIKKATKKW